MGHRCNLCSRLFQSRDDLGHHLVECSQEGDFVCGKCNCSLRTLREWTDHEQQCEPNGYGNKAADYWHLPFEPVAEANGIRRTGIQSAMRGKFHILRFCTVDESTQLPLDFMNKAYSLVKMTVRDLLADPFREYKVQCAIEIVFVKKNGDGEIEKRDSQWFSVQPTMLRKDEVEDVFSKMNSKIESYIRNGSNWCIEKTKHLDMKVYRCRSVPNVRGHSSGVQFELPESLKNKHAVLNLRNIPEGGICFKYAVLAALHYRDLPRGGSRQNARSYDQWMNSVKWDELKFPVTASQMKTFHRHNPNLAVNMLLYLPRDDEGRDNEVPIRSIYQPDGTWEPGTKKVISVLAVMVRQEGKVECHFLPVTSINRLLNHHGKQVRGIRCERCFLPFRNDAILEEHRIACYQGKQVTVCPPHNTIHKFRNWHKTISPSYVVYADIECYLERGVNAVQKHFPAAIGLLLVANPLIKANAIPNEYKVFTGTDCLTESLQYLESLGKRIWQWNKQYARVKADMNAEKWRLYHSANVCYVCQQSFSKTEMAKKKVVEHCHLSGMYRGAACVECNNKMKLKNIYLPVMFHNLKNYDAHALAINAFGKMKNWSFSVIPQTTEKYLAISAKFPLGDVPSGFDDYEDEDHLVIEADGQVAQKRDDNGRHFKINFLDTAQFMPFSLAQLVRNLSEEDMRLTNSLALPSSITRAKGIFPYSYFDSLERLSEQCLPTIDQFYDFLSDSPCSDGDYARAQEAWSILNCDTFADYMLNYLKLDVYQLADVFEAFRSMSLKEDGLDPVHYFTAPGLSWDSAWKMTKAECELLADAAMYQFFEKGIRGGMSFVNEHELKCNSVRDPDTYLPEEPYTDLWYGDVNNLYGSCLSQQLPQKDFRWLTDEECQSITEQFILNIDDLGSNGYVFDVDLEYPANVQDETIDLPLAPEHLTVEERMLTEFMRGQYSTVCEQRGLKNKVYRGNSKLLLTHFHKAGYVVHYKVLKLYLNLGLRLTRVNKGVSFTQSDFFRPYIEYNNKRRKDAKCEFERDYYKLKNNSLYGKTMENVKKRMRFRLVTDPKKFTDLTSRPDFLNAVLFNEELVGVHLAAGTIVLDKPVYIGQAVLDHSKHVMYELRYVKLKSIEGDDVKMSVVGGDTDSFFICLWSTLSAAAIGNYVEESFLPRMFQEKLLDTSNFPSTHPLYSTKYKGELGLLKDENAGKAFREWILLRPKCYSMLNATRASEAAEVKKRAKGVNRNVVKSKISHAHYKEAYRKQKELFFQQRRIGSKKHQLFTFAMLKRSLSFFEDKRAWIAPNRSYPYGYHRLPNTHHPSAKRYYPPERISSDDEGEEGPAKQKQRRLVSD